MTSSVSRLFISLRVWNVEFKRCFRKKGKYAGGICVLSSEIYARHFRYDNKGLRAVCEEKNKFIELMYACSRCTALLALADE